jgi:two-component system sensor histidine kinase RegB
VIVYFTTRLTSELRSREQELRRAEELRARSEKLEALGTLAAGAAHELATPLSTIAVVAKEVQRQFKGHESANVAADDIALIRSELDRCRDILNRMSVESGQAMGEPMEIVTVQHLVEHLVGDVKPFWQVRTVLADGTSQRKVSIPLRGFTQAVRGIVKNAVDAGGPEPVEVRVHAAAETMCLTIGDRGPGMASDVLQRAGEPFFTTKPTGEGMGLGLFLARSLVERLGGTVQIQSVVEQGTTVTVRLPLCPDGIR